MLNQLIVLIMKLYAYVLKMYIVSLDKDIFNNQLEEDDFVEIGKITATGTCNCYMNDSKNNFIMGDMG